MSIFPIFALLACRLAMRALIHPLEPVRLLLWERRGGFVVRVLFDRGGYCWGCHGARRVVWRGRGGHGQRSPKVQRVAVMDS